MLVTRPGELTRRYVAGGVPVLGLPDVRDRRNLPGWQLGDGEFLQPDLYGGVAEARVHPAEQQNKAVRRSPGRAISPANVPTTCPNASGSRSSSSASSPPSRCAAWRCGRDKDDAGKNWFERQFEHARHAPKLVVYKIKTSTYQ